jgi:uncharacterized membrane protein
VFRPGKPSTVVFQAVLPETSIALNESAYKINAAEPAKVQLFAYNFGEQKAQGRLTLALPTGWAAECPSELEVLPGERKALDLRVTPEGTSSPGEAKVRILGDFGKAGRAVLSVQFVVGKP